MPASWVRRSSSATPPSDDQSDDPAERRDQAGQFDPGGWIDASGWATSVRTSSFALRGALGRSLEDLGQLRARLDGLRYYEAGIPWFATLFGRDR